MKDDRTPNKVFYMNLETKKLKGRPINGWQEEVREDGKLTCEKVWKEKVYNREKWNKLLRTATSCRILHISRMNDYINELILTLYLLM
jgi:hypothetical protein